MSLTWLLYNLQLDDVTGADFEISLCAFGQSEKRYVMSLMYDIRKTWNDQALNLIRPASALVTNTQQDNLAKKFVVMASVTHTKISCLN